MLRIYYADESKDKEKFIFDNIDSSGKTVIIVPDQFSLQMERDVLAYFRCKAKQNGSNQGAALMDVMVTDFSVLGHKAAKEAGGRQPELIDKYGRHMLLSVIIERLSGELGIYRQASGRNSFVSMMNQLISEMKRYGTGPDNLDVLLGEVKEANEGKCPGQDPAARKTYLEYKLADIRKIYAEYEKAISGKYLDSEDYIRFYGEKLLESEIVSDADIWVYGFDTFTPLNILLLQKLLQASDSLNIILTCDRTADDSAQAGASAGDINPIDARVLLSAGGEGLFELTTHVRSQLESMAREAGSQVEICCIGDVADRDSIWNGDKFKSGQGKRPPVTMVRTSNIYTEAERAAAFVLQLVRDEGYRFSDITLICNDMDVRGKIISRTFRGWGISAFADLKRHVLHQSLVRFLMSLLSIISKGFEGDGIMNMVKSGLMGWTREEEELLGNYISQFRIRSSAWKREFTRKGDKYSDSDLERLNELRGQIVNIVAKAKDDIGRRNTAEEKVRGLYEFMEKDFDIRDKVGSLMTSQQDMGLTEAAAETAQSWKVICGLFSQILRIIGPEHISNRTLHDLMEVGLEEAEIGLVPASSDCVLIGTMQRSRISSTKVLMVTGACEGVLPVEGGQQGLLTDRELAVLEELHVSISKREEISRQEEQLAMYRTLSTPSDRLYMSCSLAGADGKSIQPSMVFSSLKDICELEDCELLGDLQNEEPLLMMNSCKGSLSYLAAALRDYMENGNVAPDWLAAINWFAENDPDSLRRITSGLSFSNRMEALGKDLADALYCGDRDKLYVSASRLERYSDCPFKHFIERGLRAEEYRQFEIGGREIGDIYHECLMKLSRRLTPDAGSVCNPDSPWMKISRGECETAVREILTEEAKGYNEGVFADEGEGRFRLERIVSICSNLAWALVNQVRKSKIREMRFEEPFGYPGCSLPAIEIDLPGGRKACLRGKIDRMDILDVTRHVPGAGEESSQLPDNMQHYNAVSIVDYKSGGNTIDVDQFRNGYRLQLMVYMNAARGADSGAKAFAVEPAGVFYFKIRDFMENTEKSAREASLTDIDKRLKSAYRMEGIVIDDQNLYEAFDSEFYREALSGEGVSSTNIPVTYTKSNETFKAASRGTLLTKEEFKELCSETDKQVERICREIYEGRIDIAPKREKTTDMDGKRRTSCTYCQYKSICLFDTSFDGCRYTEV